MEFMTYDDLISRSTQERRDIPRIGTLHVTGSFGSSDCNFYPNHEVFGTSQGGDFPLYGEFEIDRDGFGRPTGSVRLKCAFASVPGVTDDGKEAYRWPFHIYGYEVKDYVHATQMRGLVQKAAFRIELDEPFSLTDGDGLPYVDGYDLDWLIPIVLEPEQTDGGEDVWGLDKDVSRRVGVLVFGHEFSLTLNKDLSFRDACSIDLGEVNRYRTEAEFEAAFPGALAAVRKARDQGVLRVYRYDWDGKRNNRSIVPFPG